MADIRTTPYLDDFNRADESPLSGGGNWATSGLSGSGTLDLLSMNATHSTGGTSGDMYWTPQAYSGNVEVWGNAEGGQAGGIAWALDMYQSPGSGAVDGYRARQEISIGSDIVLYRVTNGSATSIDSYSGGFTGGSPTTFLLYRRIAATNTHEVWFSASGDVTVWTQAISHVDSTYTGSFYVACGIRDNSNSQILGWNGIGGGSHQNRTQIYRWIKN